MKNMRFNRVSLAIGLVLGVMLLYLAISPNALKSDSIIGGWDVVPWCTNCSGSTTDSCSNYEGELENNCNSNVTPICVDGTGGHCMPAPGYGYDPCGTNCPGWPSTCS